MHRTASERRRVPLCKAALACLVVAGCGGGGSAGEVRVEPLAVQSGAASDSPGAVANTLQVGTTIAGYPHKIDVYRPAGATRAIVFLHGHGGRTWQLAYDLGINRAKAPQTAKNVDWDWLTRNKVMAVFAQGQVKPGTTQPTWSNYVFDSGQDDVAFLKALSKQLRAQYGVTDVALAGHSSGGTMTARAWCEATTDYSAFVSLAGPMPSPTYPQPSRTCVALAPAPYFMIVGGQDTKLPAFVAGVPDPTPEQVAAGLTDSVLTSEWTRHKSRSRQHCGEAPQLAGSELADSGPTWNSCAGRIRYAVVRNADHPVASLEQFAGIRMLDLIAGFGR